MKKKKTKMKEKEEDISDKKRENEKKTKAKTKSQRYTGGWVLCVHICTISKLGLTHPVLAFSFQAA